MDYQMKQLSEELLTYARHENLFKLFVPQIYGGQQLSLSGGIQKIYDASVIFGSLGWCVNLGAGAGYFWPFFTSEAAGEVFQDDNAVIAGSGATSGIVVRKKNGYILSGSWDKCTGSAHATWFTVNAQTEEGVSRSFAVPASSVTIKQGWQLFGLKATSSDAIEINEVFVEDRHSFEIGTIQDTSIEYSIKRLPFEGFAKYCMFSSLLGLVQCMCNNLKEEYSDHTRIEVYINTTTGVVSDLKSKLLESAEDFESEPKKGITFDFATPAKSLFKSVTELFYKEGLRLANEETKSHYAWRDVMLATQHYLLK